MSYHNQIQMTRAILTAKIIKGISDGAFSDYTPDELSNLSSTQLAYMFLRHNQRFFDDHGPDPDDITLVNQWHPRFLRVQKFMAHAERHPPIKEHTLVINDLITYFNDFGLQPQIRTGNATSLQFAYTGRRYLELLAPVVVRATRSERTLNAYLANPQQFYTSPLTAEYDPDDFDTVEYKAYQRQLQTLHDVLLRVKPPATTMQLIFSDRLFNMQSYMIPELSMPIFSSLLPMSLRTLWTSDADWFAATATEISDGFYPSSWYWNNTPLTPNILTTYFVEHDPNLFNFIIDGAPSRNPFQGFNFDPPPPHGSEGPGRQTHDQADNANRDGPPPAQNDGTQQTGIPQTGAPPPPPPAGGPPPPQPPPQPTVPDDTNYNPPSMLASKARAFTAIAHSKIGVELYHDHMTRFATTDESPRSISRSEVIPGGTSQVADIKVQTRIRDVTTNYVITYTRKSRKPVFNIIS